MKTRGLKLANALAVLWRLFAAAHVASALERIVRARITTARAGLTNDELTTPWGEIWAVLQPLEKVASE